MRRIFNEGEFENKARTGILVEQIKREKKVNPTSTIIDRNVPLGSVSQDVRYLDRNSNEICRAHRYMRPDGTIGGSGLTDPKTIFIGAVHYHQLSPGDAADPLTDEEIRRILDEFEQIVG